MRFERGRARPIERVSAAQLRRGLGYMQGISGCRIAILSDDDENYVQVIQQVTEVFLAFFHHQPFPSYVQWRDVTDELIAAGCEKFEVKREA